MQTWEAFWRQVEVWAHLALTPFRMVAEAFGYSPPDIQIWCFLVVLFVVGLAAPESYGDIVLARRRARAVGKVVKIDISDDSPDTPVIDFRDASGRVWTFESSLPCTDVTRQVGAPVAVIYDPHHPKRAREEGRWLAKAYRWIVWYGVAVFLLVLVFWPGLIDWE